MALYDPFIGKFEESEMLLSSLGNIGESVHSTYSADRFVRGVLLGALVGWLVSAAADFWGVPVSLEQRFVLRLLVEGMVSGCVVLPWPLLLKTVLREKRDAFMLDQDVDAMLRGRLLGIAGGLWVGATINSMLLF